MSIYSLAAAALRSVRQFFPSSPRPRPSVVSSNPKGSLASTTSSNPSPGPRTPVSPPPFKQSISVPGGPGGLRWTTQLTGRNTTPVTSDTRRDTSQLHFLLAGSSHVLPPSREDFNSSAAVPELTTSPVDWSKVSREYKEDRGKGLAKTFEIKSHEIFTRKDSNGKNDGVRFSFVLTRGDGDIEFKYLGSLTKAGKLSIYSFEQPTTSLGQIKSEWEDRFGERLTKESLPTREFWDQERLNQFRLTLFYQEVLKPRIGKMTSSSSQA